MRQEKRKKKKGGGQERKRKVKVKTAVSLLDPKSLEILVYAHARTSQANVLLLDQKAAKCTTRPIKRKKCVKMDHLIDLILH